MPKLKLAKRERFCQEYIKDLNKKQAALRAGYSKHTADKQGCRLFTYAEVSQRVKELQDKATEKYGISMQRLVDEYKKLALTNSDDLMDYVDEYVLVDPETEENPAVYKKVRKAYLKPHESLSIDQRAAIKTIKETSQGVEVVLHDKKGALDSLTKILGGFVDKQEISGPNGGPIESKFEVVFVEKKK